MMAVTKICVTPTDLAAFLEGSLTGEERDRLVQHLNHCQDCFERYIGAARLLDAIEEEEASALSEADVIVEQNLFYDYQNHLWGKWRPSAAARRLREASEVLRTNHHVGMSPQELTDLAANLPPRNLSRRMEGEEALLEARPLESTESAESAEKRRWVRDLLLDAFATLSSEDRLIVKMRQDGFSVAKIARTLNLEQKPLYRRLEKIYKSLRSTLESKGVRAEDIADFNVHLEHESNKPGK
jgi:DNA-directed RNA polymerase specialized sigma24 family protein